MKQGETLPIRSRSRIVDKIEWAAGALCAGWACVILVIMFQHHGALWRDEIVTLWMARRESLGELWAWLDKDSFPLAWFGVVRLWLSAGLGQSDIGLRALGLLVGLAIVGLLFWITRMWSKRWPLMLLVLFALNPVMFRFCTSLRAYGFGVITMLLMVGSLWLFIERPTRKRFFAAGIFSFLAVHSVYYNSIVLAAVAIAGGVIFLKSRRLKPFAGLALISGVCALSVVPYILGPMTDAKKWNWIFAIDSSASQQFMLFRRNLDFAVNGASLVVLALAAIVVIGCAVGSVRWRSPRRRRRALFIAVALPVLLAMYLPFIALLRYETQPWYYVTLLCFTALMIDRGADLMIQRESRLRLVRVLAAVVLVAWTARGDYANACMPTTHLDLVCDMLETRVSKDDFVVVTPWYLGTSFNRYYQGPAPWATYPPLQDVAITRGDLFIQSMQNVELANLVLRKAEQTLASGHKVWFMGIPIMPKPGMVPQPMQPAQPDPTIYRSWGIWNSNLNYLLFTRAKGAEVFDSLGPKDPNWPKSYEFSPVVCFHGAIPGDAR